MAAKSVLPSWSPFLAEADPEFYDSLPETLTVYRGADRSCIEAGVSWTTDRHVAEGFARGHRLLFNPDPVVATATVRKSEIFAATNGRQESEILCLPDIERIEPFGTAASHRKEAEAWVQAGSDDRFHESCQLS